MPKTISTDPDLCQRPSSPQGQTEFAGDEGRLTLAERLQARFAEIARLSQLLLETEQRLLQQRRHSERELSAVAQRLAQSQQQLAERQAELAALRASSSWRITAPLRFLSRALQRVVRRS